MHAFRFTGSYSNKKGGVEFKSCYLFNAIFNSLQEHLFECRLRYAITIDVQALRIVLQGLEHRLEEPRILSVHFVRQFGAHIRIDLGFGDVLLDQPGRLVHVTIVALLTDLHN